MAVTCLKADAVLVVQVFKYVPLEESQPFQWLKTWLPAADGAVTVTGASRDVDPT